MLAHRIGSIDLVAPAPRPFGLRLCRSAPAGSIRAGDSWRRLVRKRGRSCRPTDSFARHSTLL